MNQYLDDGIDELKRVDHLVFVSLKYTRTVDVVRSVIERIVSAYDFLILAILTELKEKKKIKEIPNNPVMKCDLLKEKYKDNQEFMENIEIYLLLRKILRSNYERRQEYRRHVTMIADVEGKKIEMNIDILSEYFEKIKNFAKLIQEV